jgi:hypothetical protein
MIDTADLLSLETACRYHINEPTAALYTSAAVQYAINSEVARLCRKIIALDCGWLEDIYTTTPAATVALPVNCGIVRNVQVNINGLWQNQRWIGDFQRGQYQVLASGTSYPDAQMFYGSSIAFESGVTGATSLRIKFARIPAAMRYEAATAGAASSITFGAGASVVDDIYNGDKLIMLAGTSAGDIRTVSDYVGSTKVATVSVAWTSTPDTTSYYSTLLPDPLDKYTDVVALGAAIDLAARKRDDQLQQMLSRRYAESLQEMMTSLAQRQTEQALHGNYLPTGDE